MLKPQDAEIAEAVMRHELRLAWHELDCALLVDIVWQQRNYAPSLLDMRVLLETFDKLTPAQQVILAWRLRWPHGATIQEVADQFGFSPAEIATNEDAALAKLRSAVGVRVPETPDRSRESWRFGLRMAV